MRVLHVTDNLSHGGAEHQLVLNAVHLQRLGVDNIVCHLGGATPLRSTLEEEGIPVICLKGSTRLRWPRAIWRLRSIVRSNSVDLVHTTLFNAEVVGGIAARMSGVPAVTTLANIGYEPIRFVDDAALKRWKVIALRAFHRVLYRLLFSRFVAISQSVRDSCSADLLIPREKVSVIYRGLPPEAFRARDADESLSVKRELGVDDAYPLLLSVGRLRPQKGQRYLIEAMAQVVRRFPNAHLLIAGEGDLGARLRRLRTELGLERHVTFLGARTDVPRLMRASDFFVFPSLFEGLGVALLEACAAGCTCVASDLPALREVLEDGRSGRLVAPRDSQSIACAIVELATTPETAHVLGVAAQESAMDRFPMERSVSQLLALYSDALQRRVRGSPYVGPSVPDKERVE